MDCEGFPATQDVGTPAQLDRVCPRTSPAVHPGALLALSSTFIPSPPSSQQRTLGTDPKGRHHPVYRTAAPPLLVAPTAPAQPGPNLWSTLHTGLPNPPSKARSARSTLSPHLTQVAPEPTMPQGPLGSGLLSPPPSPSLSTLPCMALAVCFSPRRPQGLPPCLSRPWPPAPWSLLPAVPP